MSKELHPSDSNDKLNKLQESLHIQFNDQTLLRQALTHRSYSNMLKQRHIKNNERLEFFGDAVLKLVISEYLIQRYPDANEGDLTKLRGQLVSDHNLYMLAKKVHLGEYLFLSTSELSSGGKERASILADAFEALLGAYYFDKGLEAVQLFLIGLIEVNFEELVSHDAILDYKSELQEWLQKAHRPLPQYILEKEEGPDHQKTFFIQVSITVNDETNTVTASGDTKKVAEQMAAKKALLLLKK